MATASAERMPSPCSYCTAAIRPGTDMTIPQPFVIPCLPGRRGKQRARWFGRGRGLFGRTIFLCREGFAGFVSHSRLAQDKQVVDTTLVLYMEAAFVMMHEIERA